MKYKYLRSDDIRNLKNFEFAPRVIAQGYLSGRHKSRKAGSSTNFRDYRQYVCGDSPALVDWRVYARTDRYYIKTFEQEASTDCHIFLDSSASMAFGNGLTKLEYASFFAAALSYLVVYGKDFVSLQIFDEHIRFHTPPGSTWRHLRQIMHSLENNYPGRGTSVARALKRGFPLIRRRGSLIVLSDFYDEPADVFSSLNLYLHNGFDIHLFHILAPEELVLDKKGMVAFTDMETGQRIKGHCDVLREVYFNRINDHISRFREFATRRGINYTVARTDTHFFNLFDRLVN